MKTLSTTDPSFRDEWQKILQGPRDGERLEVETTVREILEKVRREGDRALLNLTEKFDGHRPADLIVTAQEIQEAVNTVSGADKKTLRLAFQRIRAFHQWQLKRLLGAKKSRIWLKKEGGVQVGEKVTPIERVGIYVPGGLAAYPSTVLMNAIPARVAGVKEIVMVSPWSGGKINPLTLFAAKLAGVDKIFKIGGAQAIAALAYGAETVPAVDKIVGPGNIYVATAKRLVFGQVGIDMIAGPTEVVIVADQTARPDYVASDLLSQAEHDTEAVGVVITTSQELTGALEKEIGRQLENLERREILQEALARQGLIILTRNERESVDLVNEFAPEHLELHVKNPKRLLPKIRNAGAIFLGRHTPVAVGDYLAGPNHVLPTSMTARFSSPLGVSDFLKRSSLIEFAPKALERLGPHVARLANMEGLTAHALSVEIRRIRRKPL